MINLLMINVEDMLQPQLMNMLVMLSYDMLYSQYVLVDDDDVLMSMLL